MDYIIFYYKNIKHYIFNNSAQKISKNYFYKNNSNNNHIFENAILKPVFIDEYKNFQNQNQNYNYDIENPEEELK
jgi:hypothetical protein